jgi:hypothetical protein
MCSFGDEKCTRTNILPFLSDFVIIFGPVLLLRCGPVCVLKQRHHLVAHNKIKERNVLQKPFLAQWSGNFLTVLFLEGTLRFS